MREKKKVILLAFFILFLLSVSHTFPSEKKVFLRKNWFVKSSYIVEDGGETLTSPEYAPQEWYPAALPATVLKVLVENRVYPHPWVGMNNMKIPDASSEFNRQYGLKKFSHLPDHRNPWKDPYWFWTRFHLPPEFKGQHIWLNMEGINYRAEVWLNGHQVVTSKEVAGMFGDWSLDITPYAESDQTNSLAVKVFPLDYPGFPSKPQIKAFG